MEKHAVEFKNITKKFGSVVANNHVNLYVDRGVIMAILGENGSGKTSLMNMASGIYYPDEGDIYIDGKKVVIASSKDAFRYKIGMVHQHFKLIDIFSVKENVALGDDSIKSHNLDLVASKIKEISDKYGFDIDPDKKIYDMSISEKQTVEIIKVLYRGVDILILDEPTAVLTPQETDKLFEVIKAMKNDGKTVVLITHKLNEIMEVSDVVAVMRKGEHIATVKTKDTNVIALTEMMMGHKVSLDIECPKYDNPKTRLEVKNLTVIDKWGNKKLNDVSFNINSGEILGIAAIAGSGQKELLEAIAGLTKVKNGSIIYSPKDQKKQELVGLTSLEIKNAGISLAFVPEDRLGMGLAGGMGMSGNMMLRSWDKNKGIFIDRKKGVKLAEKIKAEFDVLTPNIEYPVRKLSGGNVQKVLVGREISTNPSVLMCAYVVRGLDVKSSYNIYKILSKQKMEGVAIIFVGEDLDVLLELCDKVMVLNSGKMMGIFDTKKTTKEEIGMLMVGDK